MRNIYLFIFCICTTFGFSQSFNYQAVVRDASNNPVVNQTIGVQIAIREGGPTGESLYFETQTVTSNAYGVISLAIGTGTSSGTINDVNWSTQNQWLEIAVDITGGTTYTNLGTFKLQQVPYALYAVTSGDKSFSTTANVTSNTLGNIATDDFVFGSTQLDDDPNIPEDSSRMFFDKSQGAIRAGRADNEWDVANVGQYSTAFGSRNTASGFTSTALGEFNTASGPTSTAIGRGNQAQTSFSTAIGNGNVTSGSVSTAIGAGLTTESLYQISIGGFNTTSTPTVDAFTAHPDDRLFVIGNGTLATKSDALTILKNGNTTLNGSLTIDGDNQGTGTSYTLPAQDGNANQVMSTDGSGNVSWSTVITNDADADPTNEIELPTGGVNGQLLRTNGSGAYSWVNDAVNDADNDPTNEIELPTGGTSGQVLTSNGSGGSQWSSNVSANSVTTSALTVAALPSFCADLDGTLVLSGAGNFFKVPTWRTADAVATNLHDNGNNFDESTGAFTAPVNGFYFFSAQIRFDGINSGFFRLLIGIEGGLTLDNGLHAISQGDTTTNFHTLSVSGVLKLSVGDKVHVNVTSSADTDWSLQSESGFSGYLISRF